VINALIALAVIAMFGIGLLRALRTPRDPPAKDAI
jgi:hypothetical protein